MATLKATNLPRISTGATSDRYKGTIYEAAPTPRPITKRPTISHAIDGAKAIKAAPTVNKTSATRITRLRPILSLMEPEKREPIAAPISAIDTIKAIWLSVISGQSSEK